jgi:hypothetical protein
LGAIFSGNFFFPDYFVLTSATRACLRLTLVPGWTPPTGG